MSSLTYTKVAFTSVIAAIVYKFYKITTYRKETIEPEQQGDFMDNLICDIDDVPVAYGEEVTKSTIEGRKQSTVAEILNEMTRDDSELNYHEVFQRLDNTGVGVIAKEELVNTIIKELQIDNEDAVAIAKVIYRIPTQQPAQITKIEWLTYVEDVVLTEAHATQARISLTVEDFHAALDRVD